MGGRGEVIELGGAYVVLDDSRPSIVSKRTLESQMRRNGVCGHLSVLDGVSYDLCFEEIDCRLAAY